MSACDRLDEYLCGWLDGDERASFERHLAVCAECQAAQEFQRQMDRSLARFPESVCVPSSLNSVALPSRAGSQSRLLAVAIAAAIGLAAALGLMLSNQPQGPESETVPEIVQETTPPAPDSDPPSAPAMHRTASLRPGDGMIAVAVPSENPTVTIFQLYSTTPRLPDDRLGNPSELERTSP